MTKPALEGWSIAVTRSSSRHAYTTLVRACRQNRSFPTPPQRRREGRIFRSSRGLGAALSQMVTKRRLAISETQTASEDENDRVEIEAI
jgi:hypothetical protein